MTVSFTPRHPSAAAEMEWDAWGTADRRKELGDGVRTLLQQALGVDTHRAPSLAESAVRLLPSRLDTRHRHGLGRIVGPGHVGDDDAARLRHAGGKSLTRTAVPK